MIKSKSYLSCLERSRKIGRLKNGGLYLRHPVDAGGAFADVHIEKSPVKVHQTCPEPGRWSRLKLCALSALGGNKNNCVNLCESVKSVVNFPLCLSALVAETQLVRRSLGEGGSIKNNKLCKTNPIFKKVKWL
jgi:hypothetical protein